MYLFPLLRVLSSTLLYFGNQLLRKGRKKTITLENSLKNLIGEA